MLPVLINGTETQALIDCGASQSVIDRTWCEQNGLTITPTQTKVYGPDWRHELVQAQHLYQTNRDWRFSETEFLVMDLIFAQALLALDVCPDLGAETHNQEGLETSRT